MQLDIGIFFITVFMNNGIDLKIKHSLMLYLRKRLDIIKYFCHFCLVLFLRLIADNTSSAISGIECIIGIHQLIAFVEFKIFYGSVWYFQSIYE